MFHRPVRIFGCFQCSIRFARNVNFNRYSDRTASERNVLFTEYTCQSIGLIRPRKRVDGETTLRNLTHTRAEYNKTECSSPIHVHVCKICVCVYVYIDFPEIGIDAYAGRRLIVEQLLVNAPLFPFSVRSAR